MALESMRRIVILGAGGDATVIAEAILQGRVAGQRIEFAGFVDDKLKGESLYGKPVLGGLEDWSELDEDILFVPAIQKVKDAPRRVARVLALGIPHERWITVVHPRATVSSDARVGYGAFIAAGATVQPECIIGNFASLRAGAVLGHHCRVDEHAYVGPNAVMCGHSTLEFGAHLGPSSVLLDGKTMGPYSVAGISCAITKDVRERTIVFGNPARRIGVIR